MCAVPIILCFYKVKLTIFTIHNIIIYMKLQACGINENKYINSTCICTPSQETEIIV